MIWRANKRVDETECIYILSEWVDVQWRGLLEEEGGGAKEGGEGERNVRWGGVGLRLITKLFIG